MIIKILEFIQTNNLIPEYSKIVVGLSGGPDSVFLLYVLKELQKKINFEFIAAHLDHEWRKESHLDLEFCKKICQENKIHFVYAKASELNIEHKYKGSKEELGRAMRRYFFEKVAKENDASLIALAHHLQDQEETFFIRIIRGTSLSGLVSMKPKDGMYIRPLLETNKSDIIHYLDNHQIKYLIDPSNLSLDFLRNRIRNKVIPEIKECDNRFDENFLRTLNKLKETESFLEKITHAIFFEVSKFENNRFKINLEDFFKLDEFLQRRLIFLWLYKSRVDFELTEQFINEILRFLKNNKSISHQIHHSWSIKKIKNEVAIVKKLK